MYAEVLRANAEVSFVAYESAFAPVEYVRNQLANQLAKALMDSRYVDTSCEVDRNRYVRRYTTEVFVTTREQLNQAQRLSSDNRELRKALQRAEDAVAILERSVTELREQRDRLNAIILNGGA